MDNPDRLSQARRRTAGERRAEIRAHAASLKVDDAYVSVLVETFYDRIREDRVLGPLFEQKIDGDWVPHLAKMKTFWASVAYSAGTYSGQPVPKHKALPDVEEVHFRHWLALFEQTLRDTAPTPETVPFFMEKANRIAESLKLAMFGLPPIAPVRPA